MFLVLAALSTLYAVNFVQLMAAGDSGGALIVGTIATLLACLSVRSWRKRKERRKRL